jgi:tetratricopeptide (TPR) repeat protein
MGLKLGTPEALALAAKGASFYAMYQAKDEEKRAWFEKAEKAASQAIAKAPDYPEGYFERARALGRLSQYKGILEALAEGLAPQDQGGPGEDPQAEAGPRWGHGGPGPLAL